MYVTPHMTSNALTARPRARRSAWIRLAVCGVLTAGAWVLGNFVQLPPIALCGLKVWTGYPCPGCGMTRSVTCLARGDLAGSLHFHPLGVVSAAALVLTTFGAVLGVVRGHDPMWKLYGRQGHKLVSGFVLLLVLVWIVRVFLVPSWSPDPVPV